MIKFLKKFKEKILIALACSFIGIGTLLINTIETKAYVSDSNTLSYTLTYDTQINDYLYFSIDNGPLTGRAYDFVLLINGSYNFTGSSRNLRFYQYPNNQSAYEYSYTFNYHMHNNITTQVILGTSSSNYTFDYIGLQMPTSVSTINDIINIDFIPITDLSLEQYLTTYSQGIQNQLIELQNEYDSLQAEYTTYQNTHAYTNEQYNALITQNATLTQQVQSLQSQYDTYVSLHTYTNEQYEQLLINYNTLQNMYGQLQSDYLDLQQSYNALLKDLNPFDTSIWVNRTASLNDYVFDVSSSGSYYNSVVWFRGSYIQIDQREMESFDSFIEGDNHFHFVSESTSEIVLPSFDVIANFSHSFDYGFSVEFYLNNNIVYSSIIFHSDMTTSDNSTTNFFQYNSSLTFNKIVIDVYGGPGPSSWTESSYLRGEPGTWQNGYDYALGQLMPRINQLERDLQESNAQQQVKYSEGFNAGFESRIIHNLYME